jgi:lipoprotein-anchoring transpeptidase ErfK/SrfK
MPHIVPSIDIDISSQTLVFIDENKNIQRTYAIATAKNGAGEQNGSNCTPRGKHIVRAKIGAGCPENTVFVGRRPTGEIYTPELKEKFPGRDWILTRILWLSGCEVGRNRLGSVDTMRRYIYIHSTPDSVPMGIPVSHGCILMRGPDMIELFDQVEAGAPVNIK